MLLARPLSDEVLALMGAFAEPTLVNYARIAYSND